MPQSDFVMILVQVVVTLLSACVPIAILVLFLRRQRARTERAGYFRGRCRDCGYDPDTGTQTCPECSGPVLDVRLFRPVRERTPVPSDADSSSQGM